MPVHHFKIVNGKPSHYLVAAVAVLMVLAGGASAYKLYDSYRGLRTSLVATGNERDSLQKLFDKLKLDYDTLMKDYDDLKNQDQVKVNRELRVEIGNLQRGYDRAAKVYVDLLDFRDRGGKTVKLEEQLALAI